MTQYNSLNVKISNSQLNELKSAMKIETEIVLRLSSNIIGNSNDEISFSHTLLLTDRKVFANNSSTDIKLSIHQISNMRQSRGFLGLLGPLLKTGISLMKNVIKPLDKRVLIPLGLTEPASAVDAGMHRKILGPGKRNNTILIISNDEIKDIIEIVESLEDFTYY